MRRPALPWRALAAAALALASASVLIWALSVPAWPRTYLRSEVAYDALSVARGLALYRSHCADCHGAAARGDGPLAAGLANPPIDLAEPHTALHTAGDLFHWLSDGKPGTPMPGFAQRTSAEDRWDLINFLRLFSAGYQARILAPSVVPGQPWLGAPNFDYVDAQGRPGSLKDLRGQAVLLVFYSLPASQPRLLQLAQWQARLAERGVQVVAVPLPGSPPASAALPFIAPADGAADAATAYLLLRRTLADAGKTLVGESPGHLEFLIDRFGYVRARWLPSESPEWADAPFLLQQAERLRAEPRLMPPPDDHVH
jgi:putative copper resistance protein D